MSRCTSGDHYTFFDGQGADDDQVERALLLLLVERLGFQLGELPDGTPAGEVWVRNNDQLDAEIDNWA